MQPSYMARLRDGEWDLLVQQARASGLLGRLDWLARQLGPDAQLPAAPRAHLRWAARRAECCHRETRYEITRLRQALRRANVPLVLLKGAAYVHAGLDTVHGRFFEDVDIIVPRHCLAAVESALMLAGWAPTHLDAYDQRYYREWMHELPPMEHHQRGTTVDVHHNILPLSGRLRPSATLLLRGVVPWPEAGMEDVYTLSPPDMVLHSATHLFHDGELTYGLRDLSDLDLLLRQLSADPAFWDTLVERADQLMLGRPLFYAITCLVSLLDTPVPLAVRRRVEAFAPPPLQRGLMLALLQRGLRPQHPSCNGWDVRVARFALYVRSHWLKMPPLRLIRHLLRKAMVREMATPAPR
ncbi:MAG: nucleotidyltransferase family protein [Nitrococcus mobilis]|nr:nucleotidyltransferase family protein [Nitrococcus mobilis]